MMKLLFNDDGEYIERPTIGGVEYAHEIEVDIKPEWEGKLEQLRYSNGVVSYDETANYEINRMLAYPPIEDQLDMLYWDMKNGTSTWADTVDSIKHDFPK
jgi:hypothetical protein